MNRTVLMLLLGVLVAGGSAGAGAAGARRRFSPVWNCPYMGKQVVGKYGLDANPSGSFNGSVVWLSYGPSTWPRLKATQGDVLPCWSGKHPCTWNQSLIWTNITVASNGGVPQAGDIELHKAAVAALVEQNIPDPAWAGYGIFDWEAWRREQQIGGSGGSLEPPAQGLFLNPLGLFKIRTSIPFIWRILSAFLLA
jgi:hypothetical protein